MIKLSKVVKAIGNVGKTGLKKGKEGEKISKSSQAKQTKARDKRDGESRDILPRYNERKISDAQYKKLRDRTPSKEMRDKVNENVELPMDDYALPEKTITKRLEADHIVPMEKIVRMDGFDRLTEKQQLKILNNPENFTGLSRSANASKQDKSFKDGSITKKDKKEKLRLILNIGKK